MAYGKPGRPPKKPEFDHKKGVTQVVDSGVKCLLQNGRKWTFAEYNRFTGRWEPEPKLIDHMKAGTSALAFHTGELKKIVQPLAEQFAKLAGIVEGLENLIRNMENVQDQDPHN